MTTILIILTIAAVVSAVLLKKGNKPNNNQNFPRPTYTSEYKNINDSEQGWVTISEYYDLDEAIESLSKYPINTAVTIARVRKIQTGEIVLTRDPINNGQGG